MREEATRKSKNGWHVQELICHEHLIEGRHVPGNYIDAAREAAKEEIAKAKGGE
jgi:hypothetical protein